MLNFSQTDILLPTWGNVLMLGTLPVFKHVLSL